MSKYSDALKTLTRLCKHEDAVPTDLVAEILKHLCVDNCENPALRFDLIAAEGESRKRVQGRVIVDERGIYVQFEKFGTVYDNVPMLIEQIDGIPRAVIWSDLKQEDATHYIDIPKARLKK